MIFNVLWSDASSTDYIYIYTYSVEEASHYIHIYILLKANFLATRKKNFYKFFVLVAKNLAFESIKLFSKMIVSIHIYIYIYIYTYI